MNQNLLSVGTCFNNGCLFSTATRYQLYVHSQLFSDTARICFTNELETIKYKRITCIVPKSFLHLFFSSIIGYSVLYKYILLVRVTCEKYWLRGEANIQSRFSIWLSSKPVFFSNNPSLTGYICLIPPNI